MFGRLAYILVINMCKTKVLPVLLTAIISNLNAFVYGFGLGFPSPIAESIQTLGLLDSTTFPVFASMFTAAAAIGPFLSFPVIGLIGRKALIMITTLPTAVGWLVIALGNSASWLIIGRILTGIGSGMICVLVPIFIGEVAEAKTRGLFSSFYELFLGLGLAVCYGAGIVLPHKWLALIPIVVLTVMAIGLIFLPYSPVWLAQRGLKDSTSNTLTYLRGKAYNSLNESDEIFRAVESSRKMTFMEKLLYFRKLHVIRAIIAILLIILCKELTALDVVVTYSSIIVSSNVLLSSNTAALITILIGLVGVGVHLLLVDKLGRKVILYTSSILVLISFAILMIYFYFIRNLYPICLNISSSKTSNNNLCVNSFIQDIENLQVCQGLSVLQIVGLLIFNFSIGFGWGALSWTYLGELFPVRAKSLASTLAIFTNHVLAGVFILIFPFYDNLVGSDFTFLTLFLLNFIPIIIVLFFVPETKNKTIMEIENLFKSKFCFIN